MMTATLARPTNLRIAIAQSVTRLPVVWALIPVLVFFAARGRFSFQASEGSATGDTVAALSADYSSPVGYIGGAICYLLVTVLVALNLKSVFRMALQMKWLTILAFITIASTLWSQNPSRSLYNGVCYLLSTLFAYYLVLRFDSEQLIGIVKLTGITICLLSAIAVFGFPGSGLSFADPRNPGAWIGMFSDRTGAAKCLTFLLSPALVFSSSKRVWKQLAYAMMIIFFILMSRPVTGLIIMCLYAAAMVSLHLLRRVERKTALALGFVLVPCAAALVVIGFAFIPNLLDFFGRDTSLSGRTEIWSGLWLSIVKRPLLGYGYAAFWEGLNGESANAILAAHWVFSYAHNGLIEIVLQLGIAGAAVFFITLIKAFNDGWFCLRYEGTNGVEWYVGLLLLTCMYNVDEETLLFSKDLLSILYIVACCGLAVQAQRTRRKLSTPMEEYGHDLSPAG
jgi:exopolysaccharide production protein ExoQ